MNSFGFLQLHRAGASLVLRLLVEVCGLSLVVVHGLSFLVACGILVPEPGIEVSSPALEDGFLTTGPPGKFLIFYIKT